MSTHPSLVMMGGGSWGAALADKLRQTDGQDCIILTRSADTATALRRGHIRQLRDIRLRAPLTATSDISCLTGADFIYLAVPISGHEDALALIDNHAAKNVPVILCAKGLVPDGDGGGLFLPEYMAQHYPNRRFAILTGPSFADEVLQDKPTALLAASADNTLSEQISTHFSTPSLRIYQGHDVVGAALGGAIKNIIAIAAGIAAGQSLGDNARAGLVTRGLAETTRLASQFGAQPATIMGLAGMGDLVLSCSNQHSRNMAYGFALGSGAAIISQLAEGRYSAARLVKRAEQAGITMPICEAVNMIVNHGADIPQTIACLLARQAGTE
ncbi:MAG: Glycerol-3-phosphate dehydrogenase [NAD(P)+] [Alphaproteobacteria bacterium UBA4588]|nr:MAG: Glycerol-3-phosphate dehydrogenase [NAD(P)+] [Alphaproteobacteria bacterium UBA4588]